MHAAQLLLVSDLSHTLIERLDVDILGLDSLVLINLQLFLHWLLRALDGQRLVGTLRGGLVQH